MEEVERLLNKRYYTIQLLVPPKGQRDFSYIISRKEPETVHGFSDAFDAGERDAQQYIEWLQSLMPQSTATLATSATPAITAASANTAAPATPESERLRALYISCINCAVSAYKVLPDVGFNAFFAGISYQSPARTYFRDGYMTILCLLSIKPQWVKNQILTLARGVGADGSCPSAVLASSDGAAFWGGHYDSPAYMIIMAYEYTKQTDDYSLLDQDIVGRTMLQVLESCLGWLNSQTDGTGMIVKPGGCRLDWADNVYREGYVTYIEALYAQALYAMAEFKRRVGHPEEADALLARYDKIKEAINTLLWDDERGYYINYVSDDCREDNLSLDTIFCILFDIADDSRAKRHLKACRQLLETDFGVRCVYPFYKYQSHLVEKSAFPTRYHNGSDWPYLDGLYALALMRHGFDANHALTRWFDYSLEQGWYTPVEYYSPVYGNGSFLQAWSSTAAYAMQMGSDC